jgi:hypothetical protein
MAQRHNRDYGEHNDYVDHNADFRQLRRVPLRVIAQRFLVLAFAVAVLALLIVFHKGGL